MAVAVLKVSSLWFERGRDRGSQLGSAVFPEPWAVDSRKRHTARVAASVGTVPTAEGSSCPRLCMWVLSQLMEEIGGHQGSQWLSGVPLMREC